jgi:hypothetical protein
VSAEPIFELEPEDELLDAGPGNRDADNPALAWDVGAYLKERESEDLSSSPSFNSSSDWPSPPGEEAFGSLAGDVVRTLEPYTESDPVAILVQLLAAFGSLVPGPHLRVEADKHPGRLYTALVGDSSRGRKGTSWGRVKRLIESVDETFAERVTGGLSSGEGLIERVRDDYELNESDEKSPRDKRLLIVETELASALKVIERQGNTLSPVLRMAWDGSALTTLTRNSSLRATGTHISLIGHITIEELRRRLDATEAANGFGNRFLWVCVRRARLLPEGGDVPAQELNRLSVRLNAAYRHAVTLGEVHRDASARSLWRDVYPLLSAGGGGLLGALTTRAEAQVTRLSLLYAMLDEADAIGEAHLQAALAVWDYSARSVAHIFGDSTGNPDADAVLRALRSTPEGLTRTEISSLFGRNLSANRIDGALAALLEQSRAHFVKEPTGGRAAERWFYGARQTA